MSNSPPLRIEIVGTLPAQGAVRLDVVDERIPCACSFSAVSRDGRDDPALIVQVHDLRDRQRAESERAALVKARAKRAQAEQLTQRLAAVQRITDAALGSLAFDELISELLVRMSEVLGVDRAAILLHADDGTAAVHQMAEGVPDAMVTRTWRLPEDGFAAEVLEARGPVTAEGRAMGHPLGEAVASLLGVPLQVDGQPIGALHVGSLFPRRFSLDDATILSLAAERAALAIQRMRLFEREHLIARDLQRSLLPEALPVLPGLQTAARYLPGGAGTEVGGDWYDAIALPTGRLLLVVGDVAGRGIAAASTMGQLRSAVRSYALIESDPAGLLQRLNHYHFSMAWDDMATVLLTLIDPAAATVEYASAGHPPPLVVRPDGDGAYLVGGRGAPLGALERTAVPDPGRATIAFQPMRPSKVSSRSSTGPRVGSTAALRATSRRVVGRPPWPGGKLSLAPGNTRSGTRRPPTVRTSPSRASPTLSAMIAARGRPRSWKVGISAWSST